MRALLFAAGLTLTSPVWAQAAPPAAADAPAASPKTRADSDELDDDARSKKRAEPEPEVRRAEPSRPLPPPAEPRIDEQEPRPFFGAPRGSDSERHVEVGPDVGVWSRPAEGDTVSYSPGLAYGAHARVELLRFLGFRAYFSNSTHAVDVPRGSLGLDGSPIDQPDLEVFQLGARLEPTLMPSESLRLWAGLGIAWARATAPEPSSSGAAAIRDADRSGVLLEYGGAVGATWDAVPRWLALTLALSGGFVTDQSGDLFQERPVTAAGGTTRLAGYPEFAGSLSAHFGVGIVL